MLIENEVFDSLGFHGLEDDSLFQNDKDATCPYMNVLCIGLNFGLSFYLSKIVLKWAKTLDILLILSGTFFHTESAVDDYLKCYSSIPLPQELFILSLIFSSNKQNILCNIKGVIKVQWDSVFIYACQDTAFNTWPNQSVPQSINQSIFFF